MVSGAWEPSQVSWQASRWLDPRIAPGSMLCVTQDPERGHGCGMVWPSRYPVAEGRWWYLGGAEDFCLMNLYPTTLISLLICSNSIFVDSLEFRCRWSYHLWIKTFLLLRLQLICFLFIFCLVAQARMSSTMLYTKGERGHPHLSPII